MRIGSYYYCRHCPNALQYPGGWMERIFIEEEWGKKCTFYSNVVTVHELPGWVEGRYLKLYRHGLFVGQCYIRWSGPELGPHKSSKNPSLSPRYHALYHILQGSVCSRGRSISLNIYKSDYFSTGQQQQAGCYTTADVLTPRRRVKKLAGKGMVLICLSGNLGIVFQQ